VDRFRQLAAYVEHELGQPRRNWKDKITPWRNEQRDIIMKLAQTGASGRKAFQWIRQHATIPWNTENKEVWDEKNAKEIFSYGKSYYKIPFVKFQIGFLTQNCHIKSMIVTSVCKKQVCQ
jgi:hypothetical protein